MLRLGHSWNRWQYRVRRVVFRRLVRSLDVDPSTAKVLDIGSGVGFYINLWRRAGVADVTGVDIADSAVRRLRERLPGIRLERLDISGDVSRLGGNYDAVSAMDVLFHIVNDDLYERAFANVYTLLRPGGWFMFSEHLPSRRRGRAGQGHHVSRALNEVQEVVERTGFELVARRPLFYLMSWPVDQVSVRRRKIWTKFVPMMSHERWGNVLGAVLFPAEIALTYLMKESPTSEAMVCRKPL